MNETPDPSDAPPQEASQTAPDGGTRRGSGGVLGLIRRVVVTSLVLIVIGGSAAWEIGALARLAPTAPDALAPWLAPPRALDAALEAVDWPRGRAVLDETRGRTSGEAQAWRRALTFYADISDAASAERAHAALSRLGDASTPDEAALQRARVNAARRAGDWRRLADLIGAQDVMTPRDRGDVALAHMRLGLSEPLATTAAAPIAPPVWGAFVRAEAARRLGRADAEALYSAALDEIRTGSDEPPAAGPGALIRSGRPADVTGVVRCLAAMHQALYDESLEACRANIDRHPRDPEAWRAYGVALEMFGDNAGARRALVRAQRLRPDDAELARRIAALDRSGG